MGMSSRKACPREYYVWEQNRRNLEHRRLGVGLQLEDLAYWPSAKFEVDPIYHLAEGQMSVKVQEVESELQASFGVSTCQSCSWQKIAAHGDADQDPSHISDESSLLTSQGLGVLTKEHWK